MTKARQQRQLSLWWGYWWGPDRVGVAAAGLFPNIFFDLKDLLTGLAQLDAEMAETRSFDNEINDIKGRLSLLQSAMLREATHERKVRAAAIKCGNAAAVPTSWPREGDDK